MHQLLKDLNEQQAKAVAQTEGPVLILAGAGSGKTKTLTHRIAYLISEKRVPAQNVLAVTFTNKAAREMRERLAILLGDQNLAFDRAFMPYMGTFHSICVRLLRVDGKQIGIPRNYVIFDEDDRLTAVKQTMKQLGIAEKQYSPRTVLGAISSAKNELVSPEEYAATATLPLQKIAAEVYPGYERVKKSAAALDFDDLIGETVRLLKTVPEIRTKWQQQFSHVMIDEYQDTNAAQYGLVKMLVNSAQNNICVVGDDWQSIYSWRGADFRNILNFEQDYPNTTVIKLEQNYRSTKNILDVAHKIISQNEERSDKKLVSVLGDGHPVQAKGVQNEYKEGEFIAEKVKSYTAIRARKYSDFAILYRTNAQSRALEEAFLRYNVPYRIVGGQRFYDRKEIKDLVGYLRLIYQPADRVSFMRIVNTPARGLGPTSVARFLEWQRDTGLSIAGALSEVEHCDTLQKRAKNGFFELGEMLDALTEFAKEASLPKIMDAVLRRTGYLEHLDDGSPQAQTRVENVQELLSVAQEYESLGLSGFLEEVALVASADDVTAEDDAVTMMTFHAAKGLEFPVVFMVGMEEETFPSSRAIYDTEQMEEERRLCYVGMTRAREELYLLYARQRTVYGETRPRLASRFFKEVELDPDLSAHAAMPKFIDESDEPFSFEPKNTDNYDDSPRYVPDEDVDLQVGDKIRHKVFGEGTVAAIDGYNISVEFDGRGIKRFNAQFVQFDRI